MKPRHSNLTVLTAAALFLALPWAAAALQLTEESTFSYPLSAGGRISLENVNGDVTIEAWDHDEVGIEAVKKGLSQEALDAARIDIDAREDRIHIETRYGDDERGWRSGRDSASVDYTLRVPRSARLDEIDLVNGSLRLNGVAGAVVASLVNGKVVAQGLTGSAEISTVNGQLDVTLADLESDRSIDLSSVNGSVVLAVPGHADADIDASTVHGGIDNDFGLEVDRSEFVGRNLRGTLGRGGARVELSNVNGSIDIRQAD